MKRSIRYLEQGMRIIVLLGMIIFSFGSSSPAIALPTATVGLVIDSAGVDDNGWNEMAYNGLVKAQTDFGIAFTVYSGDDYEARLNACVAGGNDPCIAVSWLFYDALIKVAGENPAVTFAIIDAEIPEDAPNNIRGILFDAKQVGYLAGTLAGLMTAGDIVGAIGGMDIPPVVDFLEGYQNGAQCANDDVFVLQNYTQNFVDPGLGATVAAEMIGKGADVIFQAAGPTGNGAILYSAGQGVWSIGVDTDQYETLFDGGTVAGAEFLLTSAMKRVDNAVYMTVEDFITPGGSPFSDDVIYGLMEDGVGLADYHEADASIPQDVIDQILAVEDGIANETIFVDDPCSISIWHSYWDGSPGLPAFMDNLTAIKVANPDYPRIIPEFQSDSNLFIQAVQHGWGPDLFIGSNDLIWTMADANVLLDLGPYSTGRIDNYEPWALNGMKVHGELFGLPESGVVVGLYYNKAQITTPPATTEALHDLLALDGKSLTAVGDYVGSYYFYGFWNAFGGQLMTDEKLCVADQAGVDSAMSYLYSLSETGNATLLESHDGALERFKTGTSDMLINGQWALPELQGALESNLGVVPLPSGPSGVSMPMTGLNGVYVNGQLPSPPEVMGLLVDLAFDLTSLSSMQNMVDEAYTIPTRSDVSITNALVQTFHDIAANGDSRVRPIEINNYWEPFNQEINNILNGITTPRVGIKAACDSMNDMNGYPSISGNVGMEGAASLINYTGGWTDWNDAGDYIFYVVPGWSGDITPSRLALLFTPLSRSLSDVQEDQTQQDFTQKLITSKHTFDWEDVDGATVYKVQLATKPTFSTPLFTMKTTASQYAYPTALQNDRLYYWRVRAKVGEVWQAWSPIWRFESMDPLAAPALLEPAHLRIFIDTRTPEFTWQPVENASYYKIQISKSSLFDTFVQKTTVYAGDDPVSYVAVTLPNGKYYWRVRAFDSSNGKGPWSVVRVFKIKIP